MSENSKNNQHNATEISFQPSLSMVFETEHVIVRRFRSDDWKDLQAIAVSNANSPFADCDETWPTGDADVQGMTEFFSQGEQFWAIEAKSNAKVVCFVNFNGVDENKTLDIGHVMNSEYFHMDYEYEGLRLLYEYAFKHLDVEQIKATWALNDIEKLAPLKRLGMKVVNTFQHPKFTDNSEMFEGCTLVVEKNNWKTPCSLK